MDISRSHRLKGLSHPDFFVRSTMLNLFAGEKDQNPDTTHHAINAVDRYGWEEAFEFSSQLSSLSLDASSLDWLLTQIRDRSQRGPDDNTRYHLQSWFAQAPVDLLEGTMDRLGLTSRPLSPISAEQGVMPPLHIAQRRVELARRSSEECLAILEEGFERCHREEKFPHRILNDLKLVCERLVAAGFDAGPLVQQWLAFDYRNDFEWRHWRSGIAMQLAGFCKVESVAPRLIEMFDYDWDWWNEEIQRSLIAIGTPAVLRTTIELYPAQKWHGRLFLTDVLEKLRIPTMDRDITKLLRAENEDNLRADLGVALACYGTSESMRRAEQVFRENLADPERFHIAEILYAFRTILGERSATLKEWRQRQELQYHQQKEAMARITPGPLKPDMTVQARASTKTVGRNDPCPCGSGSKFKKCCLPKLEKQAQN